MTSNGWKSAAKSVLLKSGTIGSVGALGMYWGAPENLRMHADYPFMFVLSSVVYGVNYMAMRTDRSIANDANRHKFVRYWYTMLAFPRQVATHPSVAIPISFGVGFLFGKTSNNNIDLPNELHDHRAFRARPSGC